MDASERWIVKNYPVHITPNHQPPKMDILPKSFHPCYLLHAFKYLVHSLNSSDDLCLLFCLILLLCVRPCYEMKLITTNYQEVEELLWPQQQQL